MSHTPKDTLVDQIRDIFDLWVTDFHYLRHEFHLPGQVSHFIQHIQLSFRDILLHMRHNFYFLEHNLLQSDAINPFLGLIIVYGVYRNSYIGYLT